MGSSPGQKVYQLTFPIDWLLYGTRKLDVKFRIELQMFAWSLVFGEEKVGSVSSFRVHRESSNHGPFVAE